jgi:hypothetical protein
MSRAGGAGVLAGLGQLRLDRLSDAVCEVVGKVSDLADLTGHIGRARDRIAAADEHPAGPGTSRRDLHRGRCPPHAGNEWTDAGTARQRRQLNQRARGEVRSVRVHRS